jgi:hypothetical protein
MPNLPPEWCGRLAIRVAPVKTSSWWIALLRIAAALWQPPATFDGEPRAMLERESTVREAPPPWAPLQQRAVAPAEPPTPSALWPTFLRRTLAEEALRRSPEQPRVS